MELDASPPAPPLLRRPLVVAVGVIALVALAHVLATVRLMLVLGFAAILIATLLSFPIDLLSRRMKRGWAVLITLVALLGGWAGAILVAARPLADQARKLATQLPSTLDGMERWWRHAGRHGPMAQVPHGRELAQKVAQHSSTVVATALEKALPAAVNLVSLVSAMVLLLALGLFLAHEPASYRAGLCTLVPTEREPEVREAWGRVAHALRSWLGGIFVSMLIMGTLTTVGLKLAGVDGWLFLGLLTFVGTFVPYAGALASAVPGLAVALAQGPSTFGWALVVYGGVHLVEGYVVQPLIMKRAVEVRPALLLFWQLILGAALGIAGVMIATPLLVCVQVLVQYFYVERHLGKVPVPTLQA